ncbi:bifunctional phosphoribosylaminoimidazolecarboxamide formyltransferase/IMP cyclohydrolase [Hydrogenivirga sp. 128-5-R1-1]|uniref:bifunctional phosphoribosylaminoimidazolecarboxamide formyltransferase/IMP cyclohydrolase n=1 Tax=Hydrogenivirga sp. 128-5-R1-1 TaxID=392423 RepID=UPI00015EF8E8|nr:bifunctional phosphoribosylaminoimidazolecarboxamide formyltransferase/IMP cyclohydrolase [Hydrogenivirga sp. 128-5-R1-1]EDP75209.1 phosphoribosylaminoimidazolecarboxamide formyltransferase [Hydrogenivirga sp. 128-5-R1-1]
MRAVISVYRKEGVEKLARALVNLGYEILSTGGTARYLREHGIETEEIAKVTGFPEILNGRVKTLHPVIHGGILYRDWVEKDREEIDELGILPVDVVVVNLYPFEEMMREELQQEELMEFIDIGGPSMIRAAAKNFFRVIVLVDPEDYDWVVEKLEKGSLSKSDRAYLAWKAFSHTAYYDSVISTALKSLFNIEEEGKELSIPMRLSSKLRYGENPHQKGTLYVNPFEELGIARSQILQGKEMSFNNYLDADSAVRIALEFPNDPACVIVKHNNPCGVATGSDLLEAFRRAKETDPESAFGGIVAFNDKVGLKVAEELTSMFLEVVVAPEFEEEALSVLSKKKNLRVIRFLGMSNTYDVKKVSGGFLIQDEDGELYSRLEVVTERKPTELEMRDLLFAWKVCKYVKSNAIVIAKEGQTLGIGSGQVSRVDSLRCAIEKARRHGFDLKGAVLASEAFFPFRDSIDTAHDAGITAVIHPGGSIRDEEVIGAAREHGMAMVLTGMRHFRH